MVEMIDVIIVSNACDNEKKKLTQNAVYTVRKSACRVRNVVVIEQKKGIKFESAETLNYNFDFNYNRCLNFGIDHCINSFDSKLLALCNNDLVFHTGWVGEIIKSMNENNCGSASPYFKKLHSEIFPNLNGDKIGYSVRSILCGWCIVVTRKTIEAIGRLCEDVSFWYSDNIYAEQIRCKNIKHVLSLKSRVDHLESRTLFGSSRLNEYTNGQLKAYKEAVKKIRLKNK